jgi:hypothetical protein
MVVAVVVIPGVDRARTDFSIIDDHLEAIYARLARVPTRVEVARMTLMGMIGGARLVLFGMELFWRHYL